MFSIVVVLVCIPTNCTLPNFRLDIVSINHLLTLSFGYCNNLDHNHSSLMKINLKYNLP